MKKLSTKKNQTILYTVVTKKHDTFWKILHLRKSSPAPTHSLSWKKELGNSQIHEIVAKKSRCISQVRCSTAFNIMADHNMFSKMQWLRTFKVYGALGLMTMVIYYITERSFISCEVVVDVINIAAVASLLNMLFSPNIERVY